MGIKNKNRNPNLTDFSTGDLVINDKDGSLFFKSNKGLTKLEDASKFSDVSASGNMTSNTGSFDKSVVNNTIYAGSAEDNGISSDGVTGAQIDYTFLVGPTANITGEISASKFSGDGSRLTGIQSVLCTIDGYRDNYSVASGDWIGPRKQSNDYWSITYGNDTEVLTLSHDYGAAGIIVPFACFLLGFYAVINNDSVGTAATTQFALYTPNYILEQSSQAFNVTTGNANDITLMQRVTATTEAPGQLGNPMICSALLANPIGLDPGIMIYPRLKHNDNNSSDLYFRISILVKNR